MQHTGFRQIAGFMALHQALNDGLFHNALAGRNAGQLTGKAAAFYRELCIGRDHFFPGNAVYAVKQFIKSGGCIDFQQNDNALGTAQVQVGSSDHIHAAFKGHTAIRYLHILGAEAAGLKRRGGFRAEIAGCDQMKFFHCFSFPVRELYRKKSLSHFWCDRLG